jgi:hypothetical protein
MSKSDLARRARAQSAYHLICESLQLEMIDVFEISDEDAYAILEHAKAAHQYAIRSRRHRMRRRLLLH